MIKKLLIASTLLLCLSVSSIVPLGQVNTGFSDFSSGFESINSFGFSQSFSNSFASSPGTSSQFSNQQSTPSSTSFDNSGSSSPSGFRPVSNFNSGSTSTFQDHNLYQPVQNNPSNAPINTNIGATNNPRNFNPTPVQQKDCSNQANTFFNGAECVCRVGYQKVNGYCSPSSLVGGPDIYYPPQFIHSLSAYHKDSVIPKCGNNQIYNGQLCACKPGYQRRNNVCSQITQNCPENSYFENNECKCFSGFYMVNKKCVRTNSCTSNAFHNGVQCVCKTGFYMQNDQCLLGKPCPANSFRRNGQCQCEQDYYEINGLCSKCPQGKFYLSGQCVVLCGSNQVPSGNECICSDGYAIYNNQCQICPTNSISIDGYCVFCPIGSSLNKQYNRCECDQGFKLNQQGLCIKQCSFLQFYDQSSGQCKCLKGLGRLNQQCVPCPNNKIDPVTEKCQSGCKAKEIMIGNKCYCQAGLGYHNNECVDCYLLDGGFLIDGFCAVCPEGLKRIGNECLCPIGQQLISGRCSNICQPGQLIDAQGFCYTCPYKEVPVNGNCQCEPGYQRRNGRCAIQCDLMIPGTNRCAKCALGTQYDEKLQACVCGKGFYIGPNGYCIPSVIAPIQCQKGKYYSPQQGCLDCPFGCSECESANKCTACSKTGFVPRGIQCVPLCGNGIVQVGQECDDGNLKSNDGCSSLCKKEANAPVCGDGIINGAEKCDDQNQFASDGCTACKVDPGYECNGQPSKCKKATSNKGLDLKGEPLYNMVNIFVLLRTDQPFYFKNDSEMRSFIKFQFPDKSTLPQNMYCVQDISSPIDFRCLLVYTYGMPSKDFNVDFSYDKQGHSGSLRVKLDPTKSSFKSRSLK